MDFKLHGCLCNKYVEVLRMFSINFIVQMLLKFNFNIALCKLYEVLKNTCLQRSLQYGDSDF